jgi:hypothetical protein
MVPAISVLGTGRTESTLARALLQADIARASETGRQKGQTHRLLPAPLSRRSFDWWARLGTGFTSFDVQTSTR